MYRIGHFFYVKCEIFVRNAQENTRECFLVHSVHKSRKVHEHPTIVSCSNHFYRAAWNADAVLR